MLMSWIAYYIVDGKTAGVLVFFFILVHFGVYIVLKYPAITPVCRSTDRSVHRKNVDVSQVGMIFQVTMVLIIGYELQGAHSSTGSVTAICRYKLTYSQCARLVCSEPLRMAKPTIQHIS